MELTCGRFGTRTITGLRKRLNAAFLPAHALKHLCSAYLSRLNFLTEVRILSEND